MRALHTCLSTFSLAVLVAGVTACQGGTALTEEGAQDSANITADVCASRYEDCRQEFEEDSGVCERLRDRCLANTPCEPGHERDESSACVRAPGIGDVSLSGAGEPASGLDVRCEILAGESTCSFPLSSYTPSGASYRYAVKLAGVGPVTGCTAGNYEVAVSWIQSALQTSDGTELSSRTYEFQAFHCEGDEITELALSAPLNVFGICELGSAWSPATHTCIRTPRIGDVSLSNENLPQVETPFFQSGSICGIATGDGRCAFTLRSSTPAGARYRYAVKLLGVGPVTGCAAGDLAVEIDWIQSALVRFSNGTELSTREYVFQAFHCEGNDITDVPVSATQSLIGACALGSAWNPATNTCVSTN